MTVNKMINKLRLAGLICVLIITGAPISAHSQMFSEPQGQFPVIMPPFNPVESTMAVDTKGMTDSSSPFIFPPIFRAEARGGPLYWNIWGSVEDPTTGTDLDFQDDLGMIKYGFLFNFALRLQVGRASARGHWDIYFRNFRGADSDLKLPTFRFGVDYDLISRPNFRLGLNLDVHEPRPQIKLNDPRVGGRYDINGGRPFTGGFHAEINPSNLGNMSASLFASYRMSLRTSSKLDELEVAAGLRTPETMLGTLGLRGGWRFSRYNFQGSGLEIKSTMSGYFLEMVYFY